MKKQEKLSSYVPICDGISALFWPNAEVVLHDLKTNKIVYIANSYSRRKAGDSSLNDVKGTNLDVDVIGPYAKSNWNGRRLKSVTTVIRDTENSPIGLLCINHDIESFADMKELLLGLIDIPTQRDTHDGVLFTTDWREKINLTISTFAKDMNTNVKSLMSDDQQALIKALDKEGLFSIRNAVPYIAEVLQISRANLYGKLKMSRVPPEPELRPRKTRK